MTNPKPDTEALVAARGAVHGDFTDVSTYARALKDLAMFSKNWERMTKVQREGLDMILHKIARIMAGDPNHHDHWDDIAGYATITSKRITAPHPAGIAKAEAVDFTSREENSKAFSAAMRAAREANAATHPSLSMPIDRVVDNLYAEIYIANGCTMNSELDVKRVIRLFLEAK